MPKRNSRIAARLRPRAPSPIAHGESTPTGTHPGTGPRPPLTGRTDAPRVPAMSGAGPIGAILIVLLIAVMLWAGPRRRGRRDFVILRGWLRAAPRLELEVGDPRGWTGDDRLRRLDEDAWHEAGWGDQHVRASVSPDADPAEARRAWEALDEVSGGVWRISVRREHPHLEVHVIPPDLTTPARRLFGAFGDLGRSFLRRQGEPGPGAAPLLHFSSG